MKIKDELNPIWRKIRKQRDQIFGKAGVGDIKLGDIVAAVDDIVNLVRGIDGDSTFSMAEVRAELGAILQARFGVKF